MSITAPFKTVRHSLTVYAGSGFQSDGTTLTMDGSWLDDKVRVPKECLDGASTAQHLSPAELRRVLGESIVVDWDALSDSTVVVRLRMIGPRLDSGNCTGVALGSRNADTRDVSGATLDGTTRADRLGCVRPLNMTDDGNFQGANSFVFKSRVVYATRMPGSGKQVEWDGPTVVLKGCVTPLPRPEASALADISAELRRRSSREHDVLTSLPLHPNIVELVHHFESQALLLRPFVAVPWLPFFEPRLTV